MKVTGLVTVVFNILKVCVMEQQVIHHCATSFEDLTAQEFVVSMYIATQDERHLCRMSASSGSALWLGTARVYPSRGNTVKCRIHLLCCSRRRRFRPPLGLERTSDPPQRDRWDPPHPSGEVGHQMAALGCLVGCGRGVAGEAVAEGLL